MTNKFIAIGLFGDFFLSFRCLFVLCGKMLSVAMEIHINVFCFSARANLFQDLLMAVSIKWFHLFASALESQRPRVKSNTHSKKNKLRTARKCTRLIVTRCWLQSINLLPTKLFAFLSRVNWFCNIFYYRHQVLCVARALCEFCSFYLAINCTNFERSLTHLARFELELFSLFVAVIYSAFNSMK